MVEVTLPQLGESVSEGTITKWLVKEGDIVSREQMIVEVATDKADTEIPSPVAGRIAKILVEAGATVPVKSVLCQVEEGVTAATSPAPVAAGTPAPPPVAAGPGKSAFGGALASPETRKVAREVGVDPANIPGSGEFGRVTRDDVLKAAQPAVRTPAPPAARASRPR
jgi:pyruvate/2-oxoglutarate dehydrogenase complex dihydrolipoamide acyltransferase (E2) component